MPGDMCDRTCGYPHTCKIPGTSEKSPIPTSRSTVQSHMPYRTSLSQLQHYLLSPFAFITLLYPVFSYKRHLNCFSSKKLCISDTQILSRVCIFKYLRTIASADKGARANCRSCTNFYRAWTAIFFCKNFYFGLILTNVLNSFMITVSSFPTTSLASVSLFQLFTHAHWWKVKSALYTWNSDRS